MSVPFSFLAAPAGRRLFALPGMEGRAALLQQDESQFKHPQIIRYDAQCFTIHDRDTFIYSACLSLLQDTEGALGAIGC